jgi:hypothetical protein
VFFNPLFIFNHIGLINHTVDIIVVGTASDNFAAEDPNPRRNWFKDKTQRSKNQKKKKTSTHMRKKQ